MTRLLCVGDLHLDKGARYGRIPGERLAEQEAVWARALELAREHHVDAVLFAGDAFEKRNPSAEALLAFERPLLQHHEAAGAPVIAIGGNHDRSGVSEWCALDVFAEAGLIRLHSRPEVTSTPVSVDDDLAIACLPWTPVSRLVAAQDGRARDDVNRQAAELLVETARGLRAQTDGPCILLTHFSISGAATPDGADVGVFREPVLDEFELATMGYDAVVLGHIHRPQVLTPDVPTISPMFYVGSPMPLDFAEGRCEHGVWLLDLDEAIRPNPVHVDFVPIESRGFVTVDEHLSAHDWPGLVIACAGDNRVPGSYVKVRLHGTRDNFAAWPSFAGLERELYDAGAHRVWIETYPERETRARVEGLDDTVSDRDALVRWIETNVDGDDLRRGDVLDTGNRYLEEVNA